MLFQCYEIYTIKIIEILIKIKAYIKGASKIFNRSSLKIEPARILCSLLSCEPKIFLTLHCRFSVDCLERNKNNTTFAIP